MHSRSFLHNCIHHLKVLDPLTNSCDISSIPLSSLRSSAPKSVERRVARWSVGLPPSVRRSIHGHRASQCFIDQFCSHKTTGSNFHPDRMPQTNRVKFGLLEQPVLITVRGAQATIPAQAAGFPALDYLVNCNSGIRDTRGQMWANHKCRLKQSPANLLGGFGASHIFCCVSQ